MYGCILNFVHLLIYKLNVTVRLSANQTLRWVFCTLWFCILPLVYFVELVFEVKPSQSHKCYVPTSCRSHDCIVQTKLSRPGFVTLINVFSWLLKGVGSGIFKLLCSWAFHIQPLQGIVQKATTNQGFFMESKQHGENHATKRTRCNGVNPECAERHLIGLSLKEKDHVGCDLMSWVCNKK